jgi:antirestriction protein ArdC
MLGDLIYKLRGINPNVKKKYVVLFNSKENKERGAAVLEDLMIRFKFYGAAPTTDAIQLAKNAAYREIIEYILTMSARISDDTLGEIEKFINN